MKKSPDLSETLAKGASEAKEILNQTATLLEDEWAKLKTTVEESDSVPDGVKTAVERFGEAVDDVREFVATKGPEVAATATKAARQAGVPVPDDWFAEADGATDTATSTATETDVVDAELVEDAVEGTVAEATGVADTVEDTVEDTAQDTVEDTVEDATDKADGDTA